MASKKTRPARNRKEISYERKSSREPSSMSFYEYLQALIAKHPEWADGENLDAVSAYALQLMEEKTIYQLIVLDKKKRPVGLVHLHDLLGRGRIKIG